MLAAPVSVVVLTHDEEGNIGPCLDSVADWTSEIVVLDSGSTDRTLTIASRYTSKIFHNPFENYAAQRNWAQAHLPIACDWVFHIDADERVSPELATAVKHLFANGLATSQTAGLLVRRRIEFMGQRMRFGGLYPTYHCRIFRKDRGRCELRKYDQHFVVDGPMATVRADLVEITASSLGSWTQRHNRWAQMEARQLAGGHSTEAGLVIQGKLFGTPIERRRWLRQMLYERSPLFGRAFIYFFVRYVIRGGIFDGVPGLIYHVLQGFWFRFYIDACVYELRRRGVSKDESVGGR
jgi:glycosyltransferase involved in cell wall biosynthesis